MVTSVEEGKAPMRAGRHDVPPFHEDDLDLYLRRRGNTGGMVFLALLLVVTSSLAALPLVHVPTFVRAHGVLRAEGESQSLLAPTSGEIAWIRGRAGGSIRAGDTVALLARPELGARRNALHSQRRALEQEVQDLLQLVAWSQGESAHPTPASLRYGHEWSVVQAEQDALGRQMQTALREAARVGTLFSRGLASEAERTSLHDRVDELRHEAALHLARAATRWRGEVAPARQALHALAADEAALEEELARLAIVSPVDGTIDDLAAISPGSYVAAGHHVATVSPQSRLIAELYVEPALLSVIEHGARIRLQLDSYRFSNWGSVAGTVFEISPELIRVGARSVGRVRAELATDSTSGPGGALGLRRGSSVTARVPAAPRSLWSLLRSRRGDPNRAAPAPAQRLPPTRG